MVARRLLLILVAVLLFVAGSRFSSAQTMKIENPRIVSTWTERGGRDGKEIYLFVVDSDGGVWMRALQIDVPGFSGKAVRIGKFWHLDGR